MDNEEYKEMYRDFIKSGNATSIGMVRMYGGAKINEFIEENKMRDIENEWFYKELKERQYKDMPPRIVTGTPN